MNLLDNTLLQGGKYKIIRFISSGGFGCTYEAEHVLLQKRVAIKEFFVKDFCNRDETTSHVTVGTQTKVALVAKLRKKFLDEAVGLSKLHHEGIVQVTDVFEENGTAYYVMDYINGKSIHEILKTQISLPESKAVKYIVQVAHALQYVHSQNRLHLDIKPGNIMIDEHDNAILIDFGASKQYDEESGENTSTLLGKTPGYAPIEQMGNSVQTFTPATDIYSLGATLYKMLTGVTPPDATILASDDNALKELPSAISPSIREAVMKAMKVRKSERPQSVEDFLNIFAGTKPSDKKEEPRKKDVDDESTIIDDNEKNVIESRNRSNESTNNEQQKDNLTLITSSSSEKSKSKVSNYNSTIVLSVIVALLGFCYWGINGGFHSSENSENPTEMNAVGSNDELNISKSRKVDLGLSVYWAGYNLGADFPQNVGGYFEWGKISAWGNYPQDEEGSTTNLKLENFSHNEDYDAATFQWGGKWRVPTEEEMQELIDNCVWEWNEYMGQEGFVITGPNQNRIFLPMNNLEPIEACNYWTSTGLYMDDIGGLGVYTLFCKNGQLILDTTMRNLTFSIRPVCNK